jgi:hypothetical protein
MVLRRRSAAIAVAALFWAIGFPAHAVHRSVRVLFFGNSITYVGNLPSVLSSLCTASEFRCSTEMVVQGGATLADRVADQSLDRANSKGQFDYVVLQERGGDLIAPPDRALARERAEEAAATLTRDARHLGIKPILLGTYQSLPSASSALIAAEASLATKLGVAYVPVSNYFECGRRASPSLHWLYADGMHPGPDLTLMMAVLLHRQLFGSYPPAFRVVVSAPIYGTSSGLNAGTFASMQPIGSETKRTITYEVSTVQTVIELARTGCK